MLFAFVLSQEDVVHTNELTTNLLTLVLSSEGWEGAKGRRGETIPTFLPTHRSKRAACLPFLAALLGVDGHTPVVGGSGRRGGSAAEPAADPLAGGLGPCLRRLEVLRRRQGTVLPWGSTPTLRFGTTLKSNADDRVWSLKNGGDSEKNFPTPPEGRLDSPSQKPDPVLGLRPTACICKLLGGSHLLSNVSLTAARAAKNDEFYTQYCDIEAEMNAYVEHDPDVFRDRVVLCPCDDPEWSNFTRYFAANFDHLGLRKLISTSYARGAANRQPTLFESASPAYDESLHAAHGRIYVLDRDSNADGRIDLDDLSFSYLESDGDFRSDEVTRLRDEADVIVTNPPFSLFREFLAWVMEGGKRFAMIGNQNAITYKEVFPLLKSNEVWLGLNEGGSLDSPHG